MLARTAEEALATAAAISLLVFLVVCFVRLVVNTAAIRTMLENTGLFSGVACPSCHMATATATVCGHCGRDVERAPGAP